MSRFRRIEVYNTIYKQRLMPIFYHADVEVCKNVLKACYEGGCRLFEFTNRGDFAHEVFAELEKYARTELPDMILGVGSIVEPSTASLYMQLGASFIVGPTLNPEVAKVCNRRKVAWVPGCGSLSEISQAEELGAEIVKAFPGNTLGGPKFVKAARGPMPWASIMATGGVTTDEANLKAWFDAGTCCVGIGSSLFSKDIIESSNYEKITELVRQMVCQVSVMH